MAGKAATNMKSGFRRSGRTLLWSAVLGGLIIFGWPARAAAQSNVITAASPALADINAAISSAQSGDTVVVPAGSATWNGNLVINKGIALIGAGIDKTVITSAYSSSADRLTESSYLVVYEPDSPAANVPFRLSGFTFNLAGLCRGVFLVNHSPTPVNKIRVDHTKIAGGDSPFSIWGTIYGVADNNIWYGCYISIDGLDEATWNNNPFYFGTADNFYFETSKFIATSTVGAGNRSEMGARWCFRYNLLDNTGISGGVYPVLDMHGNIPNAHLSTMGAEAYDNTITESGDGLCLLDQRGGMALVYENNSITTGSVFTKVREEYLDSLNPPAFSPLTGQPQHVSNSYYWSNQHNGVTMTTDDPYIDGTVDYGGTIGLVPQENRDFWRDKGFFDGTTGVGVGLRANRPTTCTKGVGYWATDERILYKATAANTWTAYYKPYTYPHPLTWPIKLTVPNGGESWKLGSTQTITWLANDYSGPVSLYLLRGGSKVLTIGTTQASANSFRWTVPADLTPGKTYTVMITGGTYQDVSAAPFSIVGPPSLSLRPTSLTFAPTIPGRVINQKVALSNAGGGPMIWTASSNRPWLAVSPASGNGDTLLTVSVNPAGLRVDVYSGSIAVSAPADHTSPHFIMATLWMSSPDSRDGDESEAPALGPGKSPFFTWKWR